MGEHSAVVWNRLYFRPAAASRSAVGVSQGPPKAVAAPKPTSSIRTMITFGAPGGGRSGSIGGKSRPGSVASYLYPAVGRRSGIGRITRLAASGVMQARVRNARRAGLTFGGAKQTAFIDWPMTQAPVDLVSSATPNQQAPEGKMSPGWSRRQGDDRQQKAAESRAIHDAAMHTYRDRGTDTGSWRRLRQVRRD